MSNFSTLVGHVSKLFEFAGLNRLKTLIFVSKSGCSLKKKKSLQLELISEIPILVPKSGCSLKKKKLCNWNRSTKFLFSSQNHSVLQKKKVAAACNRQDLCKIVPRAACGSRARSWTTMI